MVTKNEIICALLEEIYDATDVFKDQINYGDWNDDTFHAIVADTLTRFKHLECLMDALKTVWNNK